MHVCAQIDIGIMHVHIRGSCAACIMQNGSLAPGRVYAEFQHAAVSTYEWYVLLYITSSKERD